MSIVIHRVKDDKDLAIFHKLSEIVYADDKFNIPSSDYIPEDGQLYLAFENETPVARCCACMQSGSSEIGTIGLFQALNRKEAVASMLKTAASQLLKNGAKRVIGPMDGDTWHSYRINIGPFDKSPFVKEPWNPPYYESLWGSSGFNVIEKYDSYIIDDPMLAASNQEKFYKRCIKNGYRFEPITAKNYFDILPDIYKLSREVFSKNRFYTPIELQEFVRMYRPAVSLLKTGLSWMAFDAGGKLAGYIFMFPDYADAVRSMKGSSGIPAKIRFLLNRHKARRTCMKTLGVVPQRRGSGLTAALTYLSFKNSADLGYSETLMCLMHKANDSRRFSGGIDKPFRDYALYEYEGGRDAHPSGSDNLPEEQINTAQKSRKNNIASMLDKVTISHGNRAALVYKGGSITFGDLQTKVKQCANMLTEYGLKTGERVIIMIPMSAELYVVLLAIIRCGAVAVFVDPWIPMKQIAAFSAFAQPGGFIGIAKSHVLRLLDRKLSRLKISITTGPTLLGLPARYSLHEMEKYKAEGDAAAVSKDDPALITFTSGSSGIPKGANRTHGFLIAQYEALCRELQYTDDDIDMPMFPVFALRNIAAGITSVIPDMDFKNVAEVNAELIYRQLTENNVSIVTASPPFIDRLSIKGAPSSLRRILTGGAPVSAKQLQKWKKAFPNSKIEIIYGSTEAEPVAHISADERLAAEAASGYCCGKPTPLVKTCIIKISKDRIDPENLAQIRLPAGEVGELLVAGNHVCRSYFNNSEAVLDNKVFDHEGTCWHRMGDTGYFDKDGRFFLTGRVHSTIIRKGEVLHAQLIEAEFAEQYPDAEHIAALEIDGKLVVIVQRTDTLPQASPAAPLPSVEADRLIITRTKLPLDPRHNSKIDYSKLHKQILKGAL